MATALLRILKVCGIALAICGNTSATEAQADSLEITPAWYHGAKPWSSISREGRLKILDMRRAYEANEATARERGAGGSASDAKKGRALLNEIVTKYHLPAWYRTPDTFGDHMVIWIPEVEWDKLSKAERTSLENYMSTQYSNWGIGVGRMHGHEVYFDRLVIKH
jgi:hypothetical protein